ncbi:MAG TPA: Asp-tRNA(Asn)/Glu-tRNA(Gln) amidotransferase subunit GatC [Candidatus Binataceae bacterium]|nr:Asp-tRNA(Asn)/Glu-tRNA(Gln) amidotransferase subunit GatC [Candidatus Binataceae bacterium]
MAQKRISREQVIHVSELARIELTDSELSQLETDLSNILGYIDKLNQLDTAAVEPTLQVGDPGTLWREDAVTNHPEPEAMLQNAPAREGRFFKVPKIID